MTEDEDNALFSTKDELILSKLVLQTVRNQFPLGVITRFINIIDGIYQHHVFGGERPTDRGLWKLRDP
jgi:hypothetical protein